jgi:hypothetical protein
LVVLAVVVMFEIVGVMEVMEVMEMMGGIVMLVLFVYENVVEFLVGNLLEILMQMKALLDLDVFDFVVVGVSHYLFVLVFYLLMML